MKELEIRDIFPTLITKVATKIKSILLKVNRYKNLIFSELRIYGDISRGGRNAFGSYALEHLPDRAHNEALESIGASNIRTKKTVGKIFVLYKACRGTYLTGIAGAPPTASSHNRITTPTEASVRV